MARQIPVSEMCELVLGSETLQQKPQYTVDIGALPRLFVLHSTHLRVHAGFREAKAANHLADAVARRSDSRFVIAVTARPLIWGSREAGQIAGNLDAVTVGPNDEGPLATGAGP